MKDLSGKKIAVIGGNGLIGSAIMQELKACGAHPICIDIYNDKLSETDQFIEYNVSDLANIKEFCKKLVDEIGITALVNSSFARAKGWKQDPDNIEWDEWQANLDAQLNSVCLFSLYCALRWEEKKVNGEIVNISSIFGVVSPPIHLYDNVNTFPALPYPAIKGGIISFTTFLAAKFGKKGIRANCVSPGAIEGAPIQKDDRFTSGMKENMLGRFGKPAEIAKPILFLLSADSSFITGQNLIVDGGWTKI